MNLKQRLNAKETINGIMLSELYTPNIVRILANCGYDFVLIDCEHGYFDFSHVANIIAVATGWHLPIWIRVTEHNKADVGKYLDMGARGILLSNTQSPEQVRTLVELCLYSPLGDRGVSTFRAHTDYQRSDMEILMQKANEENVVIAQIESPEAIENIDQIMEQNGLDGVLIGPNDLTMNMGSIGNYQSEQVKNALYKVARSAETHNKWSGIITGDKWLLEHCFSLGMTCFSAGSELNALSYGARINLDHLLQAERKMREE